MRGRREPLRLRSSVVATRTREQVVEIVPLHPLTREEVARFIECVTGTPPPWSPSRARSARSAAALRGRSADLARSPGGSEAPGVYRFTHDLIRDTLYEDLPDADRVGAQLVALRSEQGRRPGRHAPDARRPGRPSVAWRDPGTTGVHAGAEPAGALPVAPGAEVEPAAGSWSARRSWQPRPPGDVLAVK